MKRKIKGYADCYYKPESITIYKFMYDDLQLGGVDLLVYATIYHFQFVLKQLPHRDSYKTYLNLKGRVLFDSIRRLQQRNLVCDSLFGGLHIIVGDENSHPDWCIYPTKAYESKLMRPAACWQTKKNVISEDFCKMCVCYRQKK